MPLEKSEITKNLTVAGVTDGYVVRQYDNVVVIEFDEFADEVTFDTLQKISEFFGTKKINVGNETREGGYCETCAYSYAVVVLTVMDCAKNI